MPTSLKTAAARAQDLYYQDYAPRDAFFDVADFKFHFATIYTAMFDAIFQQVRKAGKAEDGFSNAEITSAWLVTETLEIKESNYPGLFYANPTSGVFAFGWDEFSYSLESAIPLGECKHGKCKLQKISTDEAAYLDIAPTTSLVFYWLAAENSIVFSGNVGKVLVSYIPSVDPKKDNCVLSDNIVADVIKATLDIMFKSKNGNVIDQSNDGNKNQVLPQQVDPKLTKIQQQ